MDDEGIFNIGERVVFSFGEELSKGYPKDGMAGVVVEEYAHGAIYFFFVLEISRMLYFFCPTY